jgi:hypothetical protein
MTDDQQPTTTRTPEMQAWLDRSVEIQQWLMTEHRVGMHADHPRPGCASCVFSGRFEVGE